ncbi:hypothetical protein GWN26_15415, partial [Candidatus Saccharibacteria bacterium]|nr:hypothetical protein [Calditrichia bacterium]NIW00430.1 hypothetical protein [Candidatus Saccharibacteria bacterium]
GIAEEIWSQPAANSMMGVYRLIKDNKIAFYEIVTIVEEPEGLILRLKHFNADLTGWEEKDVAMEFPLKRLTDKEAIFDGISFYRISEDSMKVIVLSEERGGEVKELKFSYSRVKDW